MIKDTSGQDQPSSQKRTKKSMIIVILLAGMFVVMGLSFMDQQAGKSVSATSLRTATVYQGRFERKVNATGRVIATNSPSLYSVAAGRVTYVKQPGEAVSSGELVATIYSPELVNLYEQEKSALEFAEIALQRQHLEARQQKLNLKKARDLSLVNQISADRELERAEISYKVQVISKVDYETAKDNQYKASLALENAKAETEIQTEIIDFELQSQKLELAKQQLVLQDYERRIKLLNLRSPVSGIIGNWFEQQDNKVQANTPLLTVVDLSAYAGELDIAQSFADDLVVGMQVTVRIGSQTLNARLQSVSPEVQNNTVKARLEFLSPEEGTPTIQLRQNQNLSAQILLEARDDILQVARGAFLQAGDFAYVVKDGLATKQNIEIGSRSLDRVEVISGLTAGDEIIISAVDTFEDETTVYVN